MGLAAGTFEFAEISLRSAALDGYAAMPQHLPKRITPSRPETAQRDWYAFLWQLEEKYWREMYGFLRDELKAQSLIVGTQLGWSPSPSRARWMSSTPTPTGSIRTSRTSPGIRRIGP